MAYNPCLADRVRLQLSETSRVTEQQMFRGLAFLVNGKLCLCVSGQELLVRFSPDLQDALLQKPGCRPMNMNNRLLTGYAYVHPDALETEADLAFWVNLALAFNPLAKAAKKRKKAGA